MHDGGACAGAAAAQGGRDLRGQRGLQLARVLRHAVLEDDAADHDRDRGGEVAHEAERRGRAGDVSRLDQGLQRDQWGLEARSDAESSDDLVDDQLVPGAFAVGEVDVEPEAERHECHA